MVVQILFFAAMKDYFPSQDRLELSESTNVRSLRETLAERKPEASSLLSLSRFAVNQTVVNDDHILQEGVVIAVLPPSSGG
ncbi:MoaD/ThiS family protein [Leptospira langatensis]|uniref:Molybdopterin synthase sulfur carrier subunit n=1 Tax=Leptospira langatensis TaxID=2484983 RepID=A0A5F1ZNQ1_9LEPT|nr:MoaD/ThiS family protein [Leptospira langatensis]TGK05488.1 MoaD/ThiS family protein [Leptospira langatensis]TGL38624.1 MoaD/ThiS family protein [Leptospira langatensis]